MSKFPTPPTISIFTLSRKSFDFGRNFCIPADWLFQEFYFSSPAKTIKTAISSHDSCATWDFFRNTNPIKVFSFRFKIHLKGKQITKCFSFMQRDPCFYDLMTLLNYFTCNLQGRQGVGGDKWEIVWKWNLNTGWFGTKSWFGNFISEIRFNFLKFLILIRCTYCFIFH